MGDDRASDSRRNYVQLRASHWAAAAHCERFHSNRQCNNPPRGGGVTSLVFVNEVVSLAFLATVGLPAKMIMFVSEYTAATNQPPLPPPPPTPSPTRRQHLSDHL